MTVIARGEIIEPEILIQTETEDILVERVHPAYIVANPDIEEPESPEVAGKAHMESITPN